jgi:hypothetical protein
MVTVAATSGNRTTRYRELIRQRDEITSRLFLASKFPRQRAELRVEIYRIERQLEQLDRGAAR